MSNRSDWHRVRKDRPCPICDRGDWCLVSEDGGAVICARVESSKRCGAAGWLHRLRAERTTRSAVRSVTLTTPRPRLELAALASEFSATATSDRLQALAIDLRVSAESLLALRVGWSAPYRAWTFPMIDTDGSVVGIRLRRPNGFNFSVPGGNEGLFVPINIKHTEAYLLICEGATDVAALLDMGFKNVVGRPSCMGGVKLLVKFIHMHQPKQVVIFADGDEPGQRGAISLASALALYVRDVRVIAPPTDIKDARAWLHAGGTQVQILEAIQTAPTQRISVRVVERKKRK